ncbi:MAG: hypothetical protein QW112_04115 [Candidatus Micrarchaeia archaeon]
MLKSKLICRDVPIFQFREKQSIGIEQKPKSHAANWNRKLIVGTIITSLIVSSILPSLAFAKSKSKKSIKSDTTVTQLVTDEKQDEPKFETNISTKIVSAENRIFYRGDYWQLKIETKDDWGYLKYYYDGEYYGKITLSDLIATFFEGKFTDREIVMGNLSFIIKGVDGKGNYCYLLYDWNKNIVTPITSGFKKEILDKLGVEVKFIFDKKTKTWRLSYQKDGKEEAYVVFSENGKIIDYNKDYNLEQKHDQLLGKE